MDNKYQILTFYCYIAIENPALEVKKHHEFLKKFDVRARIYIAFNGINAQMSIAKAEASLYLDWLKNNFPEAFFQLKVDPYHEHVLPRVTIKFREQLVALDQMPDLKNTGTHLSPAAWQKMMETKDEDTLILDVRNEYESKIGHFEGADLPPLKQFRDFPDYVEKLSQEKDIKKTKVMMYCTGGIRCETFSALLKEKGFENVYQLEGGVVHYGHKMGNKHWKGKLFVFDDRLAVPISEQEHQIISTCHVCTEKSDTYYNCANMDCNELFLSCPACAEQLQGCCSQKCIQAQRRRPFEKEVRPKPFRKWYQYSQDKPKVFQEEDCGCGSFSED